MTDWMCTKCMWKGKYKESMPVMYRGIDWQNCPSCGAVAIPITEKFPFQWDDNQSKTMGGIK